MKKQSEPLYADEYEVFDYTYHEVHYKFRFTCPILIVIGDSGTGKSLLYHASKDTMEYYYHVQSFTKVDRNMVAQTIQAHHRHLFILDRADFYMNQELGELIADEVANSSKFIIFGRSLELMPIFPCSLKEMVSTPEGTGSLITLKDYI